jgi:hypothetical protein
MSNIDPLNKTEMRARDRAERERERVAAVASLEPYFPFVVMEFDPGFFAIPANPPEGFDPVP